MTSSRPSRPSAPTTSFARVTPGFPVSLQFGDLGHSRGSNKPATNLYFSDQARGFFRAHLKQLGGAPAPGSVTAFTQTCPATTPDGGPFKAAELAGDPQRGPLIRLEPLKTFTSAGGDQNVAPQFDPIGGTSDACKTVAPRTNPTPPRTSTSSPTAPSRCSGCRRSRAKVQTTGQFGEIAARLWDLMPNGQQRLISRGVYSLTNNQTGQIVFQLHGNGYRFAKGHTVELQLLGRDSPYYQPSNSVFSVKVSNLTVALPRAN